MAIDAVAASAAGGEPAAPGGWRCDQFPLLKTAVRFMRREAQGDPVRELLVARTRATADSLKAAMPSRKSNVTCGAQRRTARRRRIRDTPTGGCGCAVWLAVLASSLMVYGRQRANRFSELQKLTNAR
jgi:hypothetical protein